MEKAEQMIKERQELYAKAVSREELHRLWEMTQQLEKEEGEKIEAELEKIEKGEQERFLGTLSFKKRAEASLPGFWARYYELKKFGKSEEQVTELYNLVLKYRLLLDDHQVERDPEPAINYLYLLSVIAGELKEDPAAAEQINKELQQLAQKTGAVALCCKAVNAHGLNAMQKKDWQEAIDIFEKGERLFVKAREIPEARQHFANILNNRGLAKLNLSDQQSNWLEKRGSISSAVVDLRDAEELYMKVLPPPLKHVDGIENRLIMAVIRLLSTESKDTAKIGQGIDQAFKEKDREKAKKDILGLKEIKIGPAGRIEEGQVSGDTMILVKAVQLGLQLADEFLEMNSQTAA